ncbi:arylformamidase [Pseudobacteriovorax antillogorgiicola]|uniref:Kynurenine formamidase n=1 Tax=Pseudobacteriovorax antillogorgiicola TaxID=1513793 RepID=A0A1Y6BNR1_9BACT|nr:arylformamidase [Pseudobacteriovorax antillogorgiicola]TCS54625.1 kynurenine formamidase [Pseudobacteriovorax antillogorgiicola]SMF17242.1 Kynurenine formamidase [Pseudobacteriovorax antillogorgiicola]
MIFDISPTVDENIAVWPGDVQFQRQWQCRIAEGSNMDLSALTSTVHVGAHGDAPSHFHRDGASIEQLDLEPYMGPCRVIAVEPPIGGLIRLEEIARQLEGNCPERLLFKTQSFPNPQIFNEDFVAFDPDLLDALGQRGVRLVGIDTPSVDPFSSKDLPAHQMLYKHDIRNLEGLVLSDVEAGDYELIALPLKLKGFDASPVRAVLRAF